MGNIRAYTGFRMKNRKFPDVLKDLRVASKALEAVNQARQDRFVATRATHLFDLHSVARARGVAAHNLTHGALTEANLEMFQRQRKMRETMRRDPAVDFEVKLVMHFSEQDGSYIGALHAENDRELMKAFMATGIATDFSYWSNTDGPEHLNARQWKKRADAWYGAVFGDALPAFVITVREPGISTMQNVLANVPDFDSRVAKVAKGVALRDWMKRLDEEARREFGTAIVFMEYAERLHESGTPEHTNLENARRFVASVLEPTLDSSLLLATLVVPDVDPERTSEENAATDSVADSVAHDPGTPD